jgi:hypothetical protein
MYPEGNSIQGYKHSQSKPPVCRPVAYLFCWLNGITPFIQTSASARLLWTKALVGLAFRMGIVHEGFQRATADHPDHPELERVNTPFLRHAPQVLVVVGRKADSLSECHVVFYGVFGFALIGSLIGHEHCVLHCRAHSENAKAPCLYPDRPGFSSSKFVLL